MSATVTLTLSPRIEALIKEKVASGQYADANEVVSEGLRLLEERDRLERLRAEIAIGFEEIERGECVPWTPDLMERLMREAEEDERNGVPIDDAVLP
jgi:antitoxin ParD1/3/4